jgi:hypothetical protein
VRFDGIDLSVNYIHKLIKILTIIFINESIPKKTQNLIINCFHPTPLRETVDYQFCKILSFPYFPVYTFGIRLN